MKLILQYRVSVTCFLLYRSSPHYFALLITFCPEKNQRISNLALAGKSAVKVFSYVLVFLSGQDPPDHKSREQEG